MILFNQKDCEVSRKNLGVPDCLLTNGRITGFIAVEPSWSLNTDTDEFTQEVVNGLIQDGTFVPFLGAVEAVNGTPENTTEEFQGGIMAVVRKGLPMFTFKYIKGWAYSRAMVSYDSFQSFKLLLVFEDGSIAGALNGNLFSGYSLGMLNTGTFMHTDGSASGYSNTVVQLTDSNEYNLYTAVLDRSTTGFNANNLQPITDIHVSGRADASENKVYFKANFDMNRATPLGGIAIANLKATVNGVQDTITALSLNYNATTKEYSFTPTATLAVSDKVVVQLYDTTNVVDVAKIGAKYYKGSSGEITVVA